MKRGEDSRAVPVTADEVVATLKRLGTKATVDAMARYAITSDNAVGVTVGALRDLGKQIGRNHELALALWDTGVYDARMLVPFVDEPEKVTPSQMDRWCKDFDSWAICDALCFHLFDKTPYAFRKIQQWSTRKGEFEKRAAFALLAAVALHNKTAADNEFLRFFPAIERAATDDRNFVKKGVSWAHRVIGRRNRALNRVSVELSKKLVDSEHSSARWIGRDAFRELTSNAVVERLKKREA